MSEMVRTAEAIGPNEVANDANRELETLRHLRRQIDRLISLNQSGSKPLGSSALARLGFVEAILADRRRRKDLFPGIDFGEPAWEILLELYAASLRGSDPSVSNLCLASGVPSTTAIRWIGVLEQAGYLRRLSGPNDRRTVLIRAEPKTVAAVRTWLDTHWQSVHGLVYGN